VDGGGSTEPLKILAGFNLDYRGGSQSRSELHNCLTLTSVIGFRGPDGLVDPAVFAMLW